jgi:hypothetical protein
MARGTEAGRRARTCRRIGRVYLPLEQLETPYQHTFRRENETMSYRRPVFSTANLLAHLEATSLGLVEVNEDERQRALEAAEEVKKADSRNWRAHRRPSPGKSRPLRVLSAALLLTLSGLLALPADAGPGCGSPGAKGTRAETAPFCGAGELDRLSSRLDQV